MPSQIEDYRKRPGRYQNIDGTLEMYMGCMFLGFALLGSLETPAFKQHPWPGMLWFYGILLSVLGLAWWATRIIKNRITYRRTGYVAYRCAKKTRAWTIALSMVIGAVVAAGFALLVRWGLRHNAADLTRLLMVGAVVATYGLFVTFMSPEHRWKLWLVALMAISAWKLETFQSLVFGLTWLASGLITLFLYIRRTRPAEQIE